LSPLYQLLFSALSRTIVGSLGTINLILHSYPINKWIILDFNGRSELKKQIIRIGRTVFHEKKNGLRRYKYIVLERDKSYFGKTKQQKKTLVLPKSSLTLISSKCSRFWLTTYLLCLVCIPIGTNCSPLLSDLFLYS
jgi:hypothetical protein